MSVFYLTHSNDHHISICVAQNVIIFHCLVLHCIFTVTRLKFILHEGCVSVGEW